MCIIFEDYRYRLTGPTGWLTTCFSGQLTDLGSHPGGETPSVCPSMSIPGIDVLKTTIETAQITMRKSPQIASINMYQLLPNGWLTLTKQIVSMLTIWPVVGICLTMYQYISTVSTNGWLTWPNKYQQQVALLTKLAGPVIRNSPEAGWPRGTQQLLSSWSSRNCRCGGMI